HHDRTYSWTEAVDLFEAGGFRVVGIRPFHVLPRNVWARLPAWVATGEGAARALERMDAALVRLPGLRRLATAWAPLAEGRWAAAARARSASPRSAPRLRIGIGE